jgi:hypothetical protein
LSDQASNLTQYLGEISAPWDQLTPSYKFTSKDTVFNQDYRMESYFEQATKGLKWISYVDSDTKKQFVVSFGKTGLSPATFTDADFKLTGCSPQIALNQLKLRESPPESEPVPPTPVDAVEEAKQAAQEARTASKKAKEAAKEAKRAAKRAIRAVKNLKRKSSEKDRKKNNK